jgi:hypothetical protein
VSRHAHFFDKTRHLEGFFYGLENKTLSRFPGFFFFSFFIGFSSCPVAAGCCL